jgi:hypothetical protein
LAGVDLTGAIYSQSTQWPGGFDPKTHNVRLVSRD